jgi:hypothetical protein
MSNEVQQIQLEIGQARDWIRKAECLERLRDNPDFKDLILEGYFKEEAARIVGLKASPNFIFAGEDQMTFLNILENGVGALQQYFAQIRMQSDAASKSLEEMENTQEEVYAEEAGAE